MQNNQERDDAIQLIKDRCQLDNVLKDYHPERKETAKSWKMTCPSCGKEKKLEYSPSKNIAKCFSCGEGAASAQSYLITFHKLEPWDSIVEMARIEGIDIPKPSGPRKQVDLEESIDEVTGKKPAANAAAKKARKTTSRKRIDHKETFLARLLENSGLDLADVTTYVKGDDGETDVERKMYQSATVDPAFNIVPGDDVIIHYYDLYGKPVTYYKKLANGGFSRTQLPFYRIRYATPELNPPDRNGNHPKYRSPYGSGSQIYIPKWVREKFKKQSKIETLYIQEGEKKADKATKHGLISVGVMGIHNIASSQQLPKEFEILIKHCQVENVVFMLDADWQDLSTSIDGKRPADMRPRSFFRAVVNFQKHFAAFTNSGIDLNIYFGHVNANSNNDKGIDDLLNNSLDEAELKSLKSSTDKAIKDPGMTNQYLTFHNITTVSEQSLLKHWHLQSKEEFVKHHMDVLKPLPKFKYGKIEWTINEDGEIEMAQPLTDEEMFYQIEKKKDSTNVNFNHKRCYTFLQNRGYYRFRESDLTYTWVHIINNIVTPVEPYRIKDFVIDFAKEMGQEPVENMLYKGAKQYLGPDSLGHLNYVYPKFYQPSIDSQNLYFKDSFLKVSKDGIEQLENTMADGQIWADSIIDFTVKKMDPLLEFERITADMAVAEPGLRPYIGEYNLVFTSEGLKCDYLQFLNNTSKFYNRNIEPSIDEELETNRHLLSKLTAFGYLLHDYRNKGNEYAIVAMDGMMSTVGDSNGRSGKSLFGEAIRQIIPTVVMDGKTTDLAQDRFAFEEVTSATKIIFMDDVKTNFIFELLFAKITGHFTIEKKGFGKFTLPQESVIKFLITTNHALRGKGGSFNDRQRLLGFSSWYNEEWKPLDDFKTRFFDEWDGDQWNRFYNLAALSLHIYLKHGLIKSPQDKLQQRKLRQDIGDTFIEWADEFFSKPQHIAQEDSSPIRLEKKELWEAHPSANNDAGFLSAFPTERKWTPIHVFKTKMKDYATYKGWYFNPSKDGRDIKVAGKEYFEIMPPPETINQIMKEYEEQHGEDTPY